jgi:tripartite-type tricarboxylate transporter receptor subunit TctC
MRVLNRIVVSQLVVAAAFLSVSEVATAQSYPAKPVTLIVPFAPGGSTDIVGRIIAEGLSKKLGQPVVVDNRAGAGGALGAKVISSAQPDGYVLGLATVSTHVINPIAQPTSTKYDPLKDFSLISQLVSVPNVVSVHPGVPAKSMKDFVGHLKSNPGKLNYATPGPGSLGHMMGETFKHEAKVFITHIPYRGAGPALNDVLAGQVQILFDNLPSSLPHIKSGKLVALAVASNKRLPALPDVPTFSEAGLRSVNDAAWVGLIGPAGLPTDIEKRLHSAVTEVLAQPDIQARLTNLLAEPVGSNGAVFKAMLEGHIARTRSTVDSAKLKFE